MRCAYSFSALFLSTWDFLPCTRLRLMRCADRVIALSVVLNKKGFCVKNTGIAYILTDSNKQEGDEWLEGTKKTDYLPCMERGRANEQCNLASLYLKRKKNRYATVAYAILLLYMLSILEKKDCTNTLQFYSLLRTITHEVACTKGGAAPP